MWDAADLRQARKEQAWPGVYQLQMHRYLDARSRYTPTEVLAGMEDVLQAVGIAPDSLAADQRTWLGEARALAGLHVSWDICDFARNTLLLGNSDGALELLERAEQAGWRDYHDILHDPRWDAVRQEPRFQSVMMRVKADIDRQRALVEAVDRADDFVAVLDAVIAGRRAGSPP